MDFYEQGYRRFMDDQRNPLELKRAGIKEVADRTLYDIKSGKAKLDKLRFGTVRELARFYFPTKFAA
jgi:hypothetical protein